MRLLFLTGQLPYPPHAGGALRTFGLIDGLHKGGHEIDLLTFRDPAQAEIAITPLSAVCREVIAIPTPQRATSTRLREILLTNKADMQGRFYSAEYQDALQRRLQANRYDVIQIESLEMATYLATIKQFAKGAKIIYDSFNAEFELQHLIYRTDRADIARLPSAIYSLIQWRRLARFEGEVCRSAAHVIAVSEEDAEAFRKLVPDVRVSVVPNGIYVDEYTRPAVPEQIELGANTLLFTGTMNYRPNVDAILWFAKQIMPAITAKVPDARLFVVGNKPHPKLDALRQRGDIEITGFVQDVRPFLYNAAVYVAPLRMGSGTRLKLLQAMAAGCAIVSTPVGALGLDVQSGRELLLAAEAASFAEATIKLLRDPSQRSALATQAQALVQTRYDWSVIVPRLLGIYRELGVG
jgi:polysaccharide biosynthesis protein PslH